MERPWGSDPHIELDTNDLKSYHTIYHHELSPSTNAESKCEEPPSSINTEKKCTETRFPRTDYSKDVSAYDKRKQLKKKVENTITWLSKRESGKPLDYSMARWKESELVASIWAVIRHFHPKLLSRKEWDNLKLLGEEVNARSARSAASGREAVRMGGSTDLSNGA